MRLWIAFYHLCQGLPAFEARDLTVEVLTDEDYALARTLFTLNYR